MAHANPEPDGCSIRDKLDGKIPEDFWERKMSEWRSEEQQVKMAIDALAGAETESVRTREQGLFSVLFAGFCGKSQTALFGVNYSFRSCCLK